MELKGKTAVVTGSTKGIGKAIATALVRGDVNVVVSSRKSAEIELTVAELNKIGLGRVAGSVCDVRDYTQVGKLFETAVKAFGGIDILVNNAGIGIFATVELMPPEDFRAILETNVLGVYHCCHRAIPLMKQRGGGYI